MMVGWLVGWLVVLIKSFFVTVSCLFLDRSQVVYFIMHAYSTLCFVIVVAAVVVLSLSSSVLSPKYVPYYVLPR